MQENNYMYNLNLPKHLNTICDTSYDIDIKYIEQKREECNATQKGF